MSHPLPRKHLRPTPPARAPGRRGNRRRPRPRNFMPHSALSGSASGLALRPPARGVRFWLTSRARICDIKLSWALPASAVSRAGRPPAPVQPGGSGSLHRLALAGGTSVGGARSQPRSGFAFARHRPGWWRAFLPPAPARLRCSVRRAPSRCRSQPSRTTLLSPGSLCAARADPKGQTLHFAQRA